MLRVSEMLFLIISSIMMRSASLPLRKMIGICEANNTKNTNCMTKDSQKTESLSYLAPILASTLSYMELPYMKTEVIEREK